MSATCHSCGAPIIWARTTSGRRMPVDEAPVDDGTLLLVFVGGLQTVRVVGRGEGHHRPHFATCPDAAKWRHPRKESTS